MDTTISSLRQQAGFEPMSPDRLLGEARELRARTLARMLHRVTRAATSALNPAPAANRPAGPQAAV